MHLIKIYTVWQISGALRTGQWPKSAQIFKPETQESTWFPLFLHPYSLITKCSWFFFLNYCKVLHSAQSLPFTPTLFQSHPTVLLPWTTVEETLNGCQGHQEWFPSLSWPWHASYHLRMWSCLSLLKLLPWVAPIYMKGTSNCGHSDSTFLIYPRSFIYSMVYWTFSFKMTYLTWINLFWKKTLYYSLDTLIISHAFSSILCSNSHSS